MEVIKVSAEDFSKYAAQIEKMSEDLPYVSEPYVYKDEENHFFVSRAGEKYGIVEGQGKVEDLDLYTLINRGDSDTPAFYDTESYSYHFAPTGSSLVSRSDKFSDELCFLSLVVNSRKAKKTIRFEQLTEELSTDLRYDVPYMYDLSEQLEYCIENSPNKVILTDLRQSILGFYYLKKSCYKLGIDDNYYQQIKLFDKFFGALPKSYDIDDFEKTLLCEGMYATIPEDMASLATGTNEKFNKIRSLAADYNNRVREV